MEDNAFEEVNRARCFNHTLQLSAKALLMPFNAGMSPSKLAPEDKLNNFNHEVQTLLDKDTTGDDKDDDGDDSDEDRCDDGSGEDMDDKVHSDNDEMDELDEQEQEKILVDTAAVRQTVTKVCSDTF